MLKEPAKYGGLMGYKKYCYWMEADDFSELRNDFEQKGVELISEARVPCRVLRASKTIGFVPPRAWYGFCKRKTSWYWNSEKAGKSLVVSHTPLGHLDIETVIIQGSSFKPERFPSSDDLIQLIGSQAYQTKKPLTMEHPDPDEKDIYQAWFEHYRPNELFDFDKVFASHSANHANFLDPKFFIRRNGTIVPYSIGDSLHVCSSCLEFLNILGSHCSIKYVVPCLGGVLFAHLPMDQYFEVRIHEARKGP